MTTTAILWFRQDLRLGDNAALDHARKHFDQILPVYIWDTQAHSPWAPGAASRWWLHHSLQSLDADLRACGSRLIIRTGDSLSILRELLSVSSARAVLWNRCYEPAAVAHDKAIKESLDGAGGVECRGFGGALWWEPWELQTASGHPYKVFTPLWRRMLKEWRIPHIKPRPRKIASPKNMPAGDQLASLNLQPKVDWAKGFDKCWQPGEKNAQRRLGQFIQRAMTGYQQDRDVPAVAGTSGLSAHLHFGEMSPGQAIATLCQDGEPPDNEGALGFIRELAWREFSYHLLYQFPHTPEQPLNNRFAAFPWRSDYAESLRAWQQGRTGVPFVDAGMRQLWHTGWMHNRVRMIVASYLTKNLLIPWQEGARWFWDTLVDADLANNTQGWQWTAGCGADAAPYFRIFNPVSQSRRFDPQGEYLRRWLPELAPLPDKMIHAPWEASTGALRHAGISLGVHYPRPLVDLKHTRQRALAAYQQIR